MNSDAPLQNPKVALIIPVFNTNRHVFEVSLRSFLELDYDNFHVILVDDGSTEIDTLSVIEKAGFMPNVTVLRQENKGVACARNVGIFFAAEHDYEFVLFADADDLVEKDLIQTLVKEAVLNNCDIVVAKNDFFSDYASMFKQTDNPRPFSVRVLSPAMAAIAACKTEFTPLVMGKLYKTELLRNVMFDESLKVSEDVDFYLRLFLKNASPVAVVSKSLYHLNRIPWLSSLSRFTIVSNERILSGLRANIEKYDSFSFSSFGPECAALVQREYCNVIADAFLELYPRFSCKIATDYQMQLMRRLKRTIDSNGIVKFFSPYSRISKFKKNVYRLSPFIYRTLYRFYLRFRKGKYGVATVA